MVELNKETEQKIQQLQLLEQNLQNFLMQKQQFQTQMVETDSALNELKDKKEAYKIIGTIMVKQSKENLEKDLKKKKEMLELRLKNLEKQEERLRDKSKKIQEEVLKDIKDKEGGLGSVTVKND